MPCHSAGPDSIEITWIAEFGVSFWHYGVHWKNQYEGGIYVSFEGLVANFAIEIDTYFGFLSIMYSVVGDWFSVVLLLEI